MDMNIIPASLCQSIPIILQSPPADLILVSDGRKVMIYKAEEEEGKKRRGRDATSSFPSTSFNTANGNSDPLSSQLLCDM